MKLDTRRLWIGRLLLAVYLSILAASVFHVHEHGGGTVVCQDCINHVDHAGHFSVGSMQVDDCLLCSFLSISYLPAEVTALAAMALVLHRDFVGQTADVVCRTKHAILLRGPPVYL